ncbi:MAG TPA: dTDP-4-dehydrorhamnose reductase [Alphaproteobacteria bacterium]|nr:dTDP-4-dehydrorhamnose reductase [Alphaproteobacteria bacterium]
MKILLLGASGQLGQSILSVKNAADQGYLIPTHQECDISDYKSLEDYITQHEDIALIINAAAYTDVTGAEKDPKTANLINERGASFIARQCKLYKIPLIHISTDYIFDGAQPKGVGYTETDKTNPVNTYGQSKLGGEKAIQATLDHYIILRSSWIFGQNNNNFLKTVLHLAREKQELEIIADQFGSPTPSDDLANTIVILSKKILSQPETVEWGIYHYAGQPSASWYELAVEIVNCAKEKGICPPSVQLKAVKSHDGYSIVKRPQNSVLDCKKIMNVFGIDQPDWKKAIDTIIK